MPSQTPIMISLDGNIGAGKSTLLDALKTMLPEVTVVQEPVADWVTLRNQTGENLLEMFYRDTSRWSYTFQNCALLTRLLHTDEVLKNWKPDEGKLPIVITERSVLTDRYVFAEMLHKEGKLDDLEWALYLRWFTHFAQNLPVKGIIHLTTSASTSKERIQQRGRSGEERIPMEYLETLHAQHNHWIQTAHLPVLDVSTEPGVSLEDTISKIRDWVYALAMISPVGVEYESESETKPKAD
jgi:deoxyguanosine kinase